MNKHSTYLGLASICAVTLSTLTACGGGGSSSASADTVSITGVAAKGIIKRGKVSAYAIGSNGLMDTLRELAAAKTNDLGEYTLTGVPAGTLVAIKVVPDTDTTILDEATGQEFAPDAGFSLRAAIKTASTASATNQAHLTPFTELAVKDAEGKTGGLTYNNVDTAYTSVGDSIGVPLTTKPEFETDGKPKNNAAARLAAVAEMVESKELGCNDVDRSKRIGCVISAMARQGLADDLVQQSIQAGLNVVKTKNTTLAAAITDVPAPSASGGGSASPSSDPVAQAKAFITTLRNNARALDEQDSSKGDSLFQKLQGLQTEMTGRVFPVTRSAQDMLQLAKMAAGFYRDAKAGIATFPNGFHAYRSSGNGMCTLYQNPELTTVATNKDNALYVGCRSYGQGSATASSYTYAYNKLRLSATADSSNTYDIKTRAAADICTYVPSYSCVTSLTPESSVSPLSATLTVGTDSSSGKINSFNLAGDLAPTYENGQLTGGKHTVNLTGLGAVDAGGITTINLSGYVTIVKAGVEDSRFTLKQGSYIKGRDSGRSADEEMKFDLLVSTSKANFAGTLTASVFSMDKSSQPSSYQPTKLDFAGSIGLNGINFFEGSMNATLDYSKWDGTPTTVSHQYGSYTIPASESSSNYLSGTVAFIGKVIIPNRPTLILSLSVDGNKTSFGQSSLSGTYYQGASMMTLAGSSNATTSTLTLTTSTGLEMILLNTATTADLKKDGATIGSFNKTTNRLSFTDNTYEQF